MNKERCLLVVSGPSGCGKDTVVRMLRAEHPEVALSVSATTRAPRAGERDGIDYHFITMQQFKQYIDDEALVEYADYVGNFYGTPRSEVEGRMERGQPVVLVIEVMGAANVKRLYPGCTTVFILPPSEAELERRLRLRGTESEEWVQKRMARAAEEMLEADKYDFCLINDDAQRCAAELYAILQRRMAE